MNSNKPTQITKIIITNRSKINHDLNKNINNNDKNLDSNNSKSKNKNHLLHKNSISFFKTTKANTIPTLSRRTNNIL